MSLKKSISGLYAITSEYNHEPSWFAQIETALSAGLSTLQFRSKLLTSEEKLRVTKQLSRLCTQYNTIFIINDDVQLAHAVQADGVHLGQSDGTIAEARSLLGNEAIIGRTCHADLNLAIEAKHEGADYVAFGQVYSSNSKQSPHRASLNFLSAAKAELKTPIVAIGGITLENAEAVFKTNIDSIAMIQGLWGCTTEQSLIETITQLNAYSKLYSS